MGPLRSGPFLLKPLKFNLPQKQSNRDGFDRHAANSNAKRWPKSDRVPVMTKVIFHLTNSTAGCLDLIELIIDYFRHMNV